MRCCNPMVREGEDIEVLRSTDEYYRFKIASNEEDIDKDIANVDHILCVSCVEKEMKIDSNDKKGNKANVEKFKVVACKICDVDHKIDMKEWNRIFKKACCSGCNIF